MRRAFNLDDFAAHAADDYFLVLGVVVVAISCATATSATSFVLSRGRARIAHELFTLICSPVSIF
jgi:hypothetical protein